MPKKREKVKIVVTGGAGFIGSHLCERLLEGGHEVICIDNFDPFYPEEIKRSNLARPLQNKRFTLLELDIRDSASVEAGLHELGGSPVDAIVHLAARAGVRPSIAEPALYADVNVTGTVAMLELARRMNIRRFVFGSSSSVYGNNERVPFSETDRVEGPISPYAATKRAAELLCHTFHHLYGLSIVCLRFFTVYGPRQRPDLAIHKFARLMLDGLPIPMYGDGTTQRDYTFIDDILEGVEEAIAYTGAEPGAFEIINLGESQTTSLRDLIRMLGEALDVEPTIEQRPPQPGDVERTFANVEKAKRLLSYRPGTSMKEGLEAFAAWLRSGVGVST